MAVAEGGGGGGVGGGGWRCPHCILTVFLQREVSAESCGGGR